MHGVRAVGLLAALAFPLIAQGQIYKCVDDTEHVTYQDFACPTGSEEAQLYYSRGRLQELPETAPGAAAEQGSLPIGPVDIQVKILIARHQLKILRHLAERCDQALDSSRDTMGCFDMQTRYQLLQPELERLRQLDPQELPSQQTQEMLAVGMRDLEYANNVFERLNREYYGRQ